MAKAQDYTAPEVENKKDGTIFLPIKSAVIRVSYCLVPSHSSASALLKQGPKGNLSRCNINSFYTFLDFLYLAWIRPALIMLK